jgi:4-amino-4-deoxy-L-arabinose transferase-like glycosyltransferase
LWNREAGLAAGLVLLGTIQFVWQARQAQIDATLCFFTTLGLYGLLRHLLLGPNWKWYVLGWAAAGFGIITKGVGFLPLLVFIPYFASRRGEWSPRPAIQWGWRWLLGPVALAAVTSIWVAPMLLAAHGDPALAQYRDEILFKQTVNRYADPWHHREPFWYFLTNVIPLLWLPLTALLPWLWTHWRDALRQRDLRSLLPLAWVVLVVLFFSISSGKRGVYVLPALPALALACAPWLGELAKRRGVQRTMFGIACGIAAVTLGAALYLLASASARHEVIDMYDIDPVAPLFAMGAVVGAACIFARPARGFLAYGLVLVATLVLVGVWISPLINESRSAAGFIRQVEAATRDVRELGFVAYKEQYLLYITRPTWNFGHARWREMDQEAADAAAWMVASPQRVLLVDDRVLALCFAKANARLVDTANRQQWFLVTGAADAACVQKGNPAAALRYAPPNVK